MKCDSFTLTGLFLLVCLVLIDLSPCVLRSKTVTVDLSNTYTLPTYPITNTCNFYGWHTNALLVVKGTPTYSLESMRSCGVTNIVKTLAEAGEVCAVYGHWWSDGRPGEGDGAYFADYHPGVSYRTCRICGKRETQSLEWK